MSGQCQACGGPGPTVYAAFHQNIGMLIVRQYTGFEGHMCRGCLHSYFWSYQAVNFTLGWWSRLSLFITPYFLISNICYYIGGLIGGGSDSSQQTYGAYPSAAGGSVYQSDDAQRLEPYLHKMIVRLDCGESISSVVNDTAARAGVAPAAAFNYLRSQVDLSKYNQTPGGPLGL